MVETIVTGWIRLAFCVTTQQYFTEKIMELIESFASINCNYDWSTLNESLLVDCQKI
jgi:hypothetical protein